MKAINLKSSITDKNVSKDQPSMTLSTTPLMNIKKCLEEPCKILVSITFYYFHDRQ